MDTSSPTSDQPCAQETPAGRCEAVCSRTKQVLVDKVCDARSSSEPPRGASGVAIYWLACSVLRSFAPLETQRLNGVPAVPVTCFLLSSLQAMRGLVVEP